MRRFSQKNDAWLRAGNRHHYRAACFALLISVVLHVSLWTNINSVPFSPSASRAEQKRYVKIEMDDVRIEPPPPVETVERQPLDSPSMVVPSGDADMEMWTELKAPELVHLPLPEPTTEPVIKDTATGTAELPPVFRQEVLAIPDQIFSEEESTLPRRWNEKDIPRIAQAPDIQLPVELNSHGRSNQIFDASQALSFIEDMNAGTPDWSTAMANRSGFNEEGTDQTSARQFTRAAPILRERPEDVSSLTGIENLLQIKVMGYQPVAGDEFMYIAIYIERASEKVLGVQPRDVLFIQDSSESMTPWKLDECRRGMKRWLDFLNPGDRFDVMGFRDSTYSCFNGWKEINEESRRKAVKFIDEMRAVGNTDVYRSLESALSIPRDAERTPIYVLITDGRPTVGVTGSSEIIEGITRYNNGRVSIFTVGGGKKVNSFFLDLISYRNRGEAVVVRGDDEIPAAMESWARQFQRPVLTDLSYSFSQVDQADVYPKQLTHLFLDRPLILYGRISKSADSPVFQVVGRSGGRWHDMVFTIDRSRIAPGDESIRTKWAWQKVYHLIGDYLGDSTENRLENIRAFAAHYGLIVPYGFSRALPKGSSD